MKVSLNLVKQFTDVEISVDELVQKIGAQLGAVEEVIDVGARYKYVVVVRVVRCDLHPNAEKLKVCYIDDGGTVQDVERGDDGLVQVVCGAPNVAEGMHVAWLPPGSTVPESFDKDPFVLDARELRGVVSNGMLASAKELAIGDSHEGLLAIDKEASPGQPFAELYDLNDYIIDIENKMFTHRPDAFGQLGVAREVAGILGKQFTSPQWYKEVLTEAIQQSDSTLPLEVKNTLPELVPRFMALALSNVEIKSSPVQIQSYLSRVGVRPINNVVDITNYMMILTAQPLHAYDYDKVKALSSGDKAVIATRFPKKGEKTALLNGKEIEPRKEAILIATDKQVIGIGGVMGGATTEVDENTKNIILEAANFDMYSVRRTSMAHGLFTDAVTRFNKGQSPLQNDRVLAYAANMFQEISGAKVAGEVQDDNHAQAGMPGVEVFVKFINDRLGLKLSAPEIKSLLENVEFTVEERGDSMLFTPPFWRTDIAIPEDVVEEVGRLYGYDKLPLELPKRTINPVHKDPLLESKANIRKRLSVAGANEVLTYSFVHGNLLDKAGQNKDNAFRLGNALSPDLQYYRISIMPSLLDKVHQNIKAGYDEFALFEIGKVHNTALVDSEGLPGEYECTGLVVTAADKLKKTGAAYYTARKYLETLAGHDSLEFKPVTDEVRRYDIVQPYELSRSALVSVKGGEFLGIVGEFKPSVAIALKLPAYTAGFEVDTAVLGPMLRAGAGYTPLSRFPKVIQDITLKVPAEITYAATYDFLGREVGAHAPDGTRIQLEPLGMYQRADDSSHKQISFRLTIASYEKTMRDIEVNNLLDSVAELAQKKIGATRV